MGSGKSSFTFILVLTFGAFLLPHHLAHCREFRRVVSCFDETIHLDCGNLSFIAVHEARYSSDVTENVTCQTEDEDEDNREPRNHSSCFEDIRISVNRRCSGNHSCSYAYSEEPKNERTCYNNRGVLSIRYDCVRESSLTNYCNRKIHQKEGYISTPGYPNFYPKLAACEWGLEAEEGQTLIFKVLHLQLRPATEVLGPSSATYMDQEAMYAIGHLAAYSDPVTKCDMDVLTVLEGSVKRLSACGEDLQALQQPVEADGSDGLTVRFKSTDFVPASGFLAFYKIQGCPNLAPSKGSYLLERNGSAALYACHDQTVFNDTLESTRFLQCVRDHHWNDTLPHCIAEKAIEETTTIILDQGTEEVEVENSTIQTIETASSVQLAPSYLEDIFIPSILIGVLLVGNSVILIIIIIIRRKQKTKLKEEGDEFDEPKLQDIVDEVKDV